jgi:hypothetical protein
VKPVLAEIAEMAVEEEAEEEEEEEVTVVDVATDNQPPRRGDAVPYIRNSHCALFKL